MDSEEQPKPSISTKKTPSSSPVDPPPEPPAKAAAPESSARPPADQIWTPEKQVWSAANRSDVARSSDVDDLLLGEEPLLFDSSKAKPVIKLPVKYEMLCEFFDSMVTSIRLLQGKPSMPTFAKILAMIRFLAKERSFTYAHLAQSKYIMPEAIMIKKVLLHDETTCCMKPELQITLQVDAVAENINGESESKYSILRKLFRERIVDFYNGHPQEDEVPEEQLPYPFNQTKPSVVPRALNFNFEPTSTESTSSAATQQQFLVPSHIPESFKRWYSQKIPIPASEKTPLMCLSQAWPKDDHFVSDASSPTKCTSKPPIFKKSSLCSPISNSLSSNCRISEQESHMLVRADSSPRKEPNIITEGTPAKRVSTPLRLMCNTPEIPTPKRCRPSSPSCDSTPLNESLKRSTRIKLFMTPEKSAKVGEEENTGRSMSDDDDDDVLDILPESLLQSEEQQKKAVEEKEAVGVGNAIKRQKLIASLPEAFDIIRLIFCSTSAMTRQELIHKLISNNLKIVDTAEVEEQLELLLELVPDWISEKIYYGGDIFYVVNKKSNLEEIRQRLAEAE